MPALSRLSYDAAVRHAVLLERLKAGEIKKALPFLREIDREVRLRLSTEPLTGFSRQRLEILLQDIGQLIDRVLTGYTGSFQRDLFELAVSEAKFGSTSLTNAVQNPLFEAVVPADSQVLAAVAARPLSVRGANGGKLLEAFITDWTRAQREAVVNTIRRGVVEGQTNQQIIQSIRGTRAQRFRNGILEVSRRQAEAVVRTSVRHVSSVARQETMKANADLVKEYQWVSTLDNRTSDICQGLSGRRFKIDAGPLPPAHVNCRSEVVEVLDERFAFLSEGGTQQSQFGPVDRKETYYSWLKKQPAEFQDQAIGPVRGKLLREGGLSAERFQALRLSKDFQPLTLAEMQKLEPLAFERAGIKIDPDTGRVVKP